MAGAKLEKTATSGIFKREGDRGTRYVVVYRDSSGKQRKETARTLDEARTLKRTREGGDTAAAGRLTFAEYAREWVERHPARDSTCSDYRAHLDRWLIPFVGERRKLADVSPLLVNQLAAHLRAAEAHRKGADGKPKGSRRFDDPDDSEAATCLSRSGRPRRADPAQPDAGPPATQARDDRR